MSTQRPTLSQRLRRQVGEEDALLPEAPDVKSRRAIKAWTRVARKGIFALLHSIQGMVLEYWEDIATSRSLPEAAPTRATMPRRTRRDDLSGIGEPIAPTSRPYPLERGSCSHTDPSGETMLRATGGRRGTEAFYHWTCQGCGSRWLRALPGPGVTEAARPERASRRTRAARPQHLTPSGEPPVDTEGMSMTTIVPPLSVDVMEISSGDEDQ